MTLFQYVRELFRRRRIEREVDEEPQFHVEMETGTHVREGLSPVEARRVALRDLGGVTQAKDAVRELRRGWPEVIAQDARYGVRRLTREPGFAATAILILAIGVGSCTKLVRNDDDGRCRACRHAQ